MATRRIFWGFCINQFGIGPSHYISSRSNFDFEFAEIFEIEKRLTDSPIRGVDKNAYRYKCFQTFESINGVSTLQPRLLFGSVGPLKCLFSRLKCCNLMKNFKKFEQRFHSDSPARRVGESTTLRLAESGS